MKNSTAAALLLKKSPGWAVFWGIFFPPSSIVYRPGAGIVVFIVTLLLAVPTAGAIGIVYFIIAPIINYGAVKTHNAKLALDIALHEERMNK